MDKFIVLIFPAGTVQPGQGLLLTRALYGTCEATKLWAKIYSKAVSSDGWTQSKVFPGTLYHASQVVTSTCHGDDFFVEASLKGLDKGETALRNHFETERLAVVGPGRDSEGRSLKQTVRWVEHKRCCRWTADPAQAEQAIHMCDLDRVETKCVTSHAVKDSRKRDGDEAVNDKQKSWLRSLVGALGYLATDIGNGQTRRAGTLSRTS